jgi:hypothetical protein
MSIPFAVRPTAAISAALRIRKATESKMTAQRISLAWCGVHNTLWLKVNLIQNLCAVKCDNGST